MFLHLLLDGGKGCAAERQAMRGAVDTPAVRECRTSRRRLFRSRKLSSKRGDRRDDARYGALLAPYAPRDDECASLPN